MKSKYEKDELDQGVIPHSKPKLGEEEIRLAAGVIASGQIAQGKKVREFERAFADMHSRDEAVCVSSGTAALHLVLLAMGIGPGDEVILPTFVCTALLNAVNYVRAIPVLADIDLQTYNIDPDDVKKKLTPRTRAVIVPHMFGLPAEMNRLAALGIPIVEDCAQALGAAIEGRPVGTFGDAAIFSFYATKVIATGEGGMVLFKSEEHLDAVREMRDYDHRGDYRIRFNYKMTDLQASIGVSQLERLEDFIKRRRAIAARYTLAFREKNLSLPPENEGHIYYRYVVGLNSPVEPAIGRLKKANIDAALPVHMPLHRYLNLEGYTNAESAWGRSISIPIYPALEDHQVQRIIDACLRINP